MYRLRCPAEADGWGLLRLLFVRIDAMPAGPASAPWKAAGRSVLPISG
jgi:hypothetical protein